MSEAGFWAKTVKKEIQVTLDNWEIDNKYGMVIFYIKCLEQRIQEVESKEYPFIVGTCNCKDSPIGKCVYNDVNDPANDFCIFCNHPNERK